MRLGAALRWLLVLGATAAVRRHAGTPADYLGLAAACCGQLGRSARAGRVGADRRRRARRQAPARPGDRARRRLGGGDAGRDRGLADRPPRWPHGDDCARAAAPFPPRRGQPRRRGVHALPGGGDPADPVVGRGHAPWAPLGLPGDQRGQRRRLGTRDRAGGVLRGPERGRLRRRRRRVHHDRAGGADRRRGRDRASPAKAPPRAPDIAFHPESLPPGPEPSPEPEP